MAIFYEHIKGCNPNNSFTSWIEWSKEAESPAASILDAKYLPNIYVGKEGKTNNLGKIITSDATGQSISKPFTFRRSIFFEYDQDNIIELSTSSQGELEIYNANQFIVNATNLIKFQTTSFETQVINATTSVKTPIINATTSLEAPVANITTKLTAKEIEASGKCQAQYFNATSDARAKSNITPAHFSALDVVNQLPIYKFQYLNTQEPVIGLIAQEAADYNLDGFNMVDNLTASGEDGDYMQIKESKLVYVLWKAVHELSVEVESLKAQLNIK